MKKIIVKVSKHDYEWSDLGNLKHIEDKLNSVFDLLVDYKIDIERYVKCDKEDKEEIEREVEEVQHLVANAIKKVQYLREVVMLEIVDEEE